MVNLKWQSCILLTVAFFLSGWTYGQQEELLTVDGEVNKVLHLSMAELQQMNRATVAWTGRDQQQKIYTGVSLAEVLALAGAPGGPSLRGDNLSKFLLVTCADGYQVVFSLAEFDDSFSDKKPILAFQEDGKALPLAQGPLRLVVPGEKKPARSCFQVLRLSIGTATIN